MAKFSKSRWEKITAVEAFLCAAHPKTFVPFSGNPERVYSLKVGIDKDIVALHPEIDVSVLASFMKHYVTLPRYLKITGRAGMPRVDLKGEVTEVISEFEAKSARKFLEVVQSRRPEKRPRPAPSTEERCSFTGKIKYPSAFQADQAMVRTRQRSGDDTSFKATSFKCRCGFYHWGRD
jgi:sRNA-binding protein